MYAHLEKARGRRGHSEDGPDPRTAGHFSGHGRPVRLDVASFTIPADGQAAQVDLHAAGRLDRRSAGVTAGPAFLIGHLISLSLAVRLRQAGPPQR